MISHPLVLAILGCDLGAALLLGYGAYVSARVVSGWEPGSASRAQLRLERQAEIAGLTGRFALGLFGLGTLILVVSFASVFPEIVPGAMCGTGVVQAGGDLAPRALGLRLAALVLLALWRLFDQLDQSVATAPLSAVTAKLSLLMTPIAALAGIDTWRALSALDVHTPVDCCTATYDDIWAQGATALREPWPDTVWIAGTALTGGLTLIAALGLLSTRGASARRGLPASILAISTPLWAIFAAILLVRVLSAYHYGVLAHHCPWCLFLGDHHFVGYPLFAALLLGLGEGIAAFFAVRLSISKEALRHVAQARARSAAWRILLAIAIYAGIAVLPAIVYRIQHGVWMSG
jgi:hypothetical protein